MRRVLRLLGALAVAGVFSVVVLGVASGSHETRMSLSGGAGREALARDIRNADGAPSTAERARAMGALEGRRRWLASATAQTQRARSQTAFSGLGAGVASRLLTNDFGSLLAGVSANPAASVAHAGGVVHYLGDYSALVRTVHGLRVETSTAPLRVADRAGGMRPVDLSLVRDGGGFAPTRPLTTVSIAGNAGGGIGVGRDGVRMALEGADVHGRALDGHDIFFGSVTRDTDAVVIPRLRGVDLLAVLRSRLSPQLLRYRLALPVGSSLRADAGGATISRAGVTLARVPAPTAQDAQGVKVPVQMRVVGDELLLSVAHRRLDLAYPSWSIQK